MSCSPELKTDSDDRPPMAVEIFAREKFSIPAGEEVRFVWRGRFRPSFVSPFMLDCECYHGRRAQLPPSDMSEAVKPRTVKMEPIANMLPDWWAGKCEKCGAVHCATVTPVGS